MLIQAEFANKYRYEASLQAEFDMYASKSDVPPVSKKKADFTSIWLNDNTRAISIPPENVCDFCKISIVLNAPEDAQINFQAALFDGVREIELHEQYTTGIVRKDEVIYFNIDFAKLNEYEHGLIFESRKVFAANFLVNLAPFNGDPDLYVHYGEEKPAELKDFAWKSEESLVQDLILISAEELNTLQPSTTKQLFIAVKGKEMSAFSLRL